MSLYHLDDVDIAALADDALNVALSNASELASAITETVIITPAVAVKAVATLEAIANYRRLRRAHRTVVAG